MNTYHMIQAAEELDAAIFATIDPKERAELSGIRYRLRTVMRHRGIWLGAGNETPIADVRADGTRARDAGHGTEMPWCEACKSYHVTPKNKAHHEALKCSAPWTGDCGCVRGTEECKFHPKPPAATADITADPSCPSCAGSGFSGPFERCICTYGPAPDGKKSTDPI